MGLSFVIFVMHAKNSPNKFRHVTAKPPLRFGFAAHAKGVILLIRMESF